MGKVKRLELWWQLYLYVTSGWDLEKKQRSLYVRLSVHLQLYGFFYAVLKHEA
jgi:hypothetical protein